jgi:hypothetical protein
LEWHPISNELAFIDMSGHWCVVSGIKLASVTVKETTKKPSSLPIKNVPVVDPDNEMLDDEQVFILISIKYQSSHHLQLHLTVIVGSSLV